MTNKEYHAHAAVGKSQIFNLATSPQYFKYRLDNLATSPTLEFGTAFHTAVLEPELFTAEYAVAPECDRRTKDGKAVWEQFISESDGKIVLSATDYATITGMVAAVMANKLAASLIKKSQHEQSHFWTDPETGIECKCRPDMEYPAIKMLIDLKSCNHADTDTFSRDCVKWGYQLQAAHYLTPFPSDWGFMFIAVEKKPPYAVNVMTADSEFIAAGKCIQSDLLALLKECQTTGNWYGYNGKDGSANELSLPYWAVDNNEEEGE